MELTYNNQTLEFPDFLIAGAARSGTSSLYFYLRAHPEIFMPEFKEPHFFNFVGKRSPHPDRSPWTVEDYTKLFLPAEKSQLIGEASASYLYYYEEFIKNIKRYYSNLYRNLKIIIILRNPVERAWSYYMLGRRKGHKEDFFETVRKYNNPHSEKNFNDFIRSGMYDEQLRAFNNTFPHLKIFLFEEFVNNVEMVLKDIFIFLNVKNKNFLPENISTVYNASGEPSNKVFMPVYNILFRKSSIKNLLKPLIPYYLRQKIKTRISNKIVKKKHLPDEIKEYLLKLFKPSLLSLLTIIQDPKQKKIINSWLSL